MHLTTSPVDWYAARAAGVAAYLLLGTVVCLGLTMAGKKRLERWPRFALEDVHRFAGILTGAFLAIHVATIAIDSYTPFSLAGLLVPFVSSYRPLPVALGIVSAELLVALGRDLDDEGAVVRSVRIENGGEIFQGHGRRACKRHAYCGSRRWNCEPPYD